MAERTIEDLNLMDDFLFQEVLSDKEEGREAAKILLSTIMDEEFGEITVRTQKVATGGSPGRHGIRMDVYLEIEANESGKKGTVCDVEVQNTDTKNLPERTRYYQALIDSKMLKPGENYKNLSRLLIIMIVPVDLFGYGRLCYNFEQRCIEIPELSLNDGARRIFLYSKGKSEERRDLAELLQYIEKSCKENAVNDATKRLHQIVNHVKHNEEVGVRYMKAIEYEYMIRERAEREGMEKGMKEGMEKGMKEGLEKGMEKGTKEGEYKNIIKLVTKKLEKRQNIEQIAEALEEDIETITKIIELIGEAKEKNESLSYIVKSLSEQEI